MTENTKFANYLKKAQLRDLRNIATDESIQNRFLKEASALIGIQKHREKYIGQYIFAVDRAPADLNDHAVNVGDSTITGFSYLNNWLKGHFVENKTKIEWTFLLLSTTLLTIESELSARRSEQYDSLSVYGESDDKAIVSHDVTAEAESLNYTDVENTKLIEESIDSKISCNSVDCCKCCSCDGRENCKK